MKERELQKYQLPCDSGDTCGQHPIVCLVCSRRTDLRDCYKEFKR